MALPYLERRYSGPLERPLGSCWPLPSCVQWRPCRSQGDVDPYRKLPNVCVGSSVVYLHPTGSVSGVRGGGTQKKTPEITSPGASDSWTRVAMNGQVTPLYLYGCPGELQTRKNGVGRAELWRGGP